MFILFWARFFVFSPLLYVFMYVCMYVCMYVNMCVCLYVSVYVFAIYLFSIGTVNNSPLQLGAFSLVQFASLCCMSSKSIDSIKALNNFRYLVMSSCLLSGQFLCLFIWCFRSSRCVLHLVQWNRRWSIVWSPGPHEHLASSHSLKRWRYALVFPCPDSTAASFGAKFIFIPSLSRTVGKY